MNLVARFKKSHRGVEECCVYERVRRGWLRERESALERARENERRVEWKVAASASIGANKRTCRVVNDAFLKRN